jgi:hypothetical protein
LGKAALLRIIANSDQRSKGIWTGGIKRWAIVTRSASVISAYPEEALAAMEHPQK